MARTLLMYCISALLCMIIQPALAVKNLLSILDEEPSPGIGYQQSNVVTHQKVGISFADVKTEARLRFPGGHILQKVESDEELNSEGYMVLRFEKGHLEYSILTIHQHDGYEAMNGKIHDPLEGTLTAIINCGPECHQLVKRNAIMPNDSVPEPEISPEIVKPFKKNVTDRSSPNQAGSRAGSNPMISMSCYYSLEYATFVGADFIDTEVADLNWVMQKNRFSFRFECICKQLANLDETEDSTGRINDIALTLGPWGSLMQSADMATVFYDSYTSDFVCGRVLAIDPLLSGVVPLMFLGHMCSSYTLPHEAGHLLGARHNIEQDPTPGSNHGYLIPRTDGHTIMAYGQGQHTRRIPFYSTPSRAFRYKRRKIGNGHTANNRLTILQLYMYYVDFGDEAIPFCGSAVCQDIPTLDCVALTAQFACNTLISFFYCPLECGYCSCGSDAHSGLCQIIWENDLCADSTARGFCPRTCGC